MPLGNSGDGVPGAGLGFPVTTDHKGNIALSSGEENIQDSIRIIIGTAKGERVMRPEFGCEIHEHVFNNITGTTITLVESSVEEALIEWEPRIDVEDVNVRRDADVPSKLLIEIHYIVRSTNSEGNMVYPFYLNE